MSQAEPMDVDGINNDFDDKENSLRHSNIPRTPCMEKGYGEFDVSELNMKLRYSITPASSPLSKSLTSNCLDNRSFNNNDSMNSVVIGENHNLTRSLNSTITRYDTQRSLKSLPLQALSNGQTSENKATSVLLNSFDSKSEDTNVTVTLSGVIDDDENISMPNTPSPVLQTMETTTPTKEVPKHDGGSPIMRGLKSVLNMFRTSQSPIPEPENKKNSNTDLLSPVDPNDLVELETNSILASTPIVTKRRDSKGSKRSSPLKESITFNDDLEKELQWKDDTTILFKEEKIPLHKLFPAHFLSSSSKKTDSVMVIDSITEQNANMNTSLEYMDISNNDSELLSKVTSIAATELQETLTLESDGEFVDCETTVNDDICDNREDNSNISNVTVQCNETNNPPNHHQPSVNNSQISTDPSPLLENFSFKNSNLSQLMQQVTDAPNQNTDIVKNDFNDLEKYIQSEDSCAVEKQEVLEPENNMLGVSQLVNELLGLTYHERFDNEKQNICNNKQINKNVNDALEIITPITNITFSKDCFEIGDNLNKDGDDIISPSEVPLPDEDDVEHDINSGKLVVPVVIHEDTAESISEIQSTLDVGQSKLAPTESFYKISDNEKETTCLQNVYSEHSNNSLQQNNHLTQYLNSGQNKNTPEHHQIISKEVKLKMSAESNMIESRDKLNEIPLENIDNKIYITTDQSELIIENVSAYNERFVTGHSSVLSDELVCQDSVKNFDPCPENNCKHSFSSVLNLTETLKNDINIQGPDEVITIVTNTNQDKNLKDLSEPLNEVSEQVNARKTANMCINLNYQQENMSFIDKVGNLEIVPEHVANIISEEPHNFQQNNSCAQAQEKHDHLKYNENLNKIKTESVCTDNHPVSSMTISILSKGITEPVCVNNEEICILSNIKKSDKEIQNTVLSNCEELINVHAKEQTHQMTDKIKDFEVVYSEKQVCGSLCIDNNMNTEVIKEDLTVVNESTIRNMNIPPSLSHKNLSEEYNLNNIDNPLFSNSMIMNVDFPDNYVYTEHIISNTCIEKNNVIGNYETGQETDNKTVTDTTSVKEEFPAHPLFNNNIEHDVIKIENIDQPCAMLSNETLPCPEITSKAHNLSLEEIDDPLPTKPEPHSEDIIEEVGAAVHIATEQHNCKEQINFNVIKTELITDNIESTEITHAGNEILSVSLIDNKTNTEKVEKNDHAFNTELVESPPLSPEISCKGYSFNFDDLEDPFTTKTIIRMSPPPGYTSTSLPSKEKNKKSNLLNSHNGVLTLHFEHRNQQNSVLEINSTLNILNEQCSETKEQESTVSKREVSSNVNDSVDSPFDINFEKIDDNDTIHTNTKVSDCQMEANSNHEINISVEKKEVTEELYKTRSDILLNKEKCTFSSTQHTRDIGDFQAKNVFNLPEMSGVFICKSTVCLSDPMASDLQTEVDINPFDNKTTDSHDINNVEVVDVSFIASSLSKTAQDAAIGDVNTEDEDTVEGPFFESVEFSNVDKISDQDDMINFTDTSTRGINGNVDNEEMFIDAEAFDFLLNQNKRNVVTDSGKESLFLKFDPLFAKRMSSDGVLTALSEVKRRQSTPKKILKALTVDVTCDQIISGPSNSNITMEIHNTLESSFEDPNVTISKPMMVVNPAINASSSQRNKPCTPPRVNRRSLTFTSPAIAVIDRLLSLNGTNSPLNQESMNTYNRREPNEADLVLTQLRELLAEKEIHVQNLRTESKELKNRLCTLESQVEKAEVESEQKLRRINELSESLAEKTKINKSMTVVLEEYERTMASLIAEIERDKKCHAEERTRLKNERNEQTAHLASMELAFNDLHSKYEKSKQVIMSCKANEEVYKRSLEEFQENLLKMQKNYESLKQHATSQLNHANREFERLKRAHEAEILKLNAMVKRKEVDICSLEETLAQKIKTNEELAAICDDLINKVG